MVFDFRARFGRSLKDIGAGLSYGEAFHLALGLLRDQSSHLFASVAGWSFVMDRGAHMAQIVAEAVVNMTRDEKKQREPIHFGWPWDKPEPKFEQVSEEELKQYKASLRARSAFAQLRG